MEALTKRNIRDGREFDHLFPTVSGTNEVIERSADLSHTLDLIPWVVRNFHWQAAGIAKRLKGRNLRETCRNIFNFCYEHIQYTKDEEGKEQVRSPARSWKDRKAGVDCDCYTVFISSILTVLAIRHTLRVTKYADPEGLDPDPPYQHIYVIVPHRGDHLTIDPVTDHFNHEVPYLKNRDIPMTLEFLNGPPAPSGLRGVDYEDLFRDETQFPLLGQKPTRAERLRSNPAPLRPATGKEKLALQRAIQTGVLPPGTTITEFRAYNRQRFIDRYGMTPEEYSDQQQREIARQKYENSPAVREQKAKMMAELRKRGVAFTGSETRDELIGLLRGNPPKKKGAKIINAINKVNPVTALLRTGVLIGAKINYMGVGQLVWALLPKAEAQRRGWDPREYDKMAKAWTKLKNAYFAGGGKIEKLTEALIKGKFNSKKGIVLSGLGNVSVRDVLGDELFESEVAGALDGATGGLGEAVTAGAALAAATAVLGAVAAILKSVQKPPEGGAPVVEPRNPAAAALAMQEAAKTGNSTIDKIIASASTATATVDAFNQIRQNIKTGGANPDGATPGISDEGMTIWDQGGDEAATTYDETAGKEYQQADNGEDDQTNTDFVKYAKWGGLAVGVGGLLYLGYRAMSQPSAKGGKSPALAGTAKKTKTRKPTTKRKQTLNATPVP
ncbi:MAG: hypothetical protein AAGN35_15275 [Bacteroidota bacterium]